MFQDHQQQQQHQPNCYARNIQPTQPKWMRASCCARFGFGGKLVHFTTSTPDPYSPDANIFSVDIYQVVTEPTVFEKASELYWALTGDGSSFNLPAIADLCARRASMSQESAEKCIWECLQAHLQRHTRQRYIEIIGGSNDVATLAERVKKVCGITLSATEESAETRNGSFAARDGSILGDELQEDEAEDETETPSPWPLPTSPDEIDQLELPTDAQSRNGLMCQLVTSGKYSAAVELCIVENKWTDALQLAMLGSRRLYDRTQRRYYEHLKDPMSKFICLVANERWDLLVATTSVRHPESWRQIFGILLNHVQSNELAEHLEQLGRKMESNGVQIGNLAPVCYIAAGLVDRLVENLSRKKVDASLTAEQLHDIVEKATVLRVSLGGGSHRALDVGPALADSIGRYSNLLVEQGLLTLALQLLDSLPEETDRQLMELRYRVYTSCSGFVPAGVRRVKPPFEAIKPVPQQQQQQYQAAPRSRTGSFVPPAPSMNAYGHNVAPQSQTYNQAPPPASNTASQGHSVSTVKTTRGRYPSYSSDGISYPSSAAVASTAPSMYPSSTMPYPGQQQYPSYVASPPIYQQQPMAPPPSIYHHQQQPPQPLQPPPISQQQPSFGLQNQHMGNATMTSNFGYQSPVPQLPPPPPGPAVELQHRPWNDPPPLSPKKKSAPKNAEIPAPVTFPVVGAGGAVPTPVAPISSPYQFQNPGYQQQSAFLQEQPMQPSPVPTPPPVVSVPPEHENILAVLRRLGELTASQAPSVQTRRRIEDGLQKMNTSLPPLLAASRLSRTTLAELHQLVDCIRAYDYNSALGVHARIVEGSDFSTIAGFMPSVKVLIQTAAQMGVYYS